MSEDINQIEQRAMGLQAKGKDEEALKEYLNILKLDPNSRRIRKTVGDLHLKLGDTRSAEKRYLEVVESMRKDGQYRMAIPLYKELCKMRAKDPDMFVELGDCYFRSNFVNDAIGCYAKAVEMTNRQKPEYAQEIQRKVVQLKPADLSERVKLAEILEHANWSEKSSDEWCALAEVSRKIGKPDDQAIFLERALAVREHWTLRRDAARARLDAGDSRRALEHLKSIYKTQSGDADVCMLLAQGLQGMKKMEQAGKVWMQAADLCIEKRRFDSLLTCYRQAQACGFQEPGMAQKIAKAEQDEKKIHLRLHRQEWAQPKRAESAEFFKAELFFEYGQLDAALKVLKEVRHKAVSISVLRSEIFFEKGEKNQGVDEIQKLPNLSQEAQIDVQSRLTVLGLLTDDDDVMDDLLEDDLMGDDFGNDDLAEDDMGDDDLGDDNLPDDVLDGTSTDAIESLIMQAESFAADGNLDAAIDLYTQVLDISPDNDFALNRIPELMTQSSGINDIPLEEDGDFADIDPEQFSFGEPMVFGEPIVDVPVHVTEKVPTSSDDETLALARSYFMIGNGQKAKELLLDRKDAGARCVLGSVYLQLGDLRQAKNTLEEALEIVHEGSLDHLEILWALATVFTQQEKARSAIRLLDEITALEPSWRERDIQAWKTGLELLRG